jgi:hypothetical protein
VDLEPDELVTDLESRVGDAPDLIQVVGFLGEAHGEDAELRVRMYADSKLMRWVEIERSAIHRRAPFRTERDDHAPMTVLWVEVDSLLEEFSGRPRRLPMEFLNDRAELFFEPPVNTLEAIDHLKMSADYYGYGMTRASRRPRNHC